MLTPAVVGMRDSNRGDGDSSSLLTTSPMVQRFALCAAFLLAGYHAAGTVPTGADTGAGRSDGQDGAVGQEWGRSKRVRPLLAVDINRASAEELAILPGIGPVAAAAIVESRRADGPFSVVGDLERVHGIGPKTIEAVRPYLLRLAEGAENAAPANR